MAISTPARGPHAENVASLELQRTLARQRRFDSIPDEDNVRLELVDGSMYKYKGKVETVASEIEGSTGAIAFRARFSNPEKLLKHGASGKIKLSTDVENVLMIPQKAVMEIQDKNYVFLVGKDNRVKMQGIVLGNRKGLDYIVQSGLNPGDRIVLEGVQILRDGDKIKPTVKKF